MENCFTILHWFLPTAMQISHIYIYIHTYMYVYIYVYITFLLSLLPSPHPTLLGHHRVPACAPCFIQQLPSILHMIVCTCQCYFLNLSHPHLVLLCPQSILYQVHQYLFFQLLYICVSFSLSGLFHSLQETLGSSTSL